MVQQFVQNFTTNVVLNMTLESSSICDLNLEKYLVQIGYTVKQEEEYENQETSITDGDKCVVCDRLCTSVYREKIVCTICKKFFLKCVKSRCYKDFCCANDSTCDMKHITRCSFCWWSKCVISGLTNAQPPETMKKKI